MDFLYTIGSLFLLAGSGGEEQCRRPVILHSNSTSATPPLNDGESITVTCFRGYSNGHSQSSKSVCKEGTLSPPVPECYTDCLRPVIPQSDAVSPTPELLHGEFITVTCDDNYSNGKTRSTTSQCKNGLIKPAILGCYEDCIPRIIPHSDHSTQQPNLLNGQTTTINCWGNYSMGPDSQSVTLKCNDGELNDETVTCYENCQHVQIPINGNISEGSPPFFHNEEVRFQCSASYILVGETKIVCTNGSWSADSPVCTIATCEVPPLTAKLHVSGCTPNDSVVYETVCQYSCAKGYDLNGEANTTCTADGTFSPNVPNCQIVTCEVPPLTAKLNVSGCTPNDLVDYGTICQYSCAKGYDLNGEENTTCTADGTFSPDAPTCQIVTCEVPPLTMKLGVSGCTPNGSVDYGTICQYSCAKGYDLNGEENTTCTANGTFSSNAPTCQKEHQIGKIIALSVGTPVAFAIVIIVAVAICTVVKRYKSGNLERDQERTPIVNPPEYGPVLGDGPSEQRESTNSLRSRNAFNQEQASFTNKIKDYGTEVVGHHSQMEDASTTENSVKDWPRHVPPDMPEQREPTKKHKLRKQPNQERIPRKNKTKDASTIEPSLEDDTSEEREPTNKHKSRKQPNQERIPRKNKTKDASTIEPSLEDDSSEEREPTNRHKSRKASNKELTPFMEGASTTEPSLIDLPRHVPPEQREPAIIRKSSQEVSSSERKHIPIADSSTNMTNGSSMDELEQISSEQRGSINNFFNQGSSPPPPTNTPLELSAKVAPTPVEARSSGTWSAAPRYIDAVSDEQLAILAQKVPHEKYSELSTELEIKYNEAEDILNRNNGDSAKATRECLFIWKDRTGGSSAKLKRILRHVYSAEKAESLEQYISDNLNENESLRLVNWASVM